MYHPGFRFQISSSTLRWNRSSLPFVRGWQGLELARTVPLQSSPSPGIVGRHVPIGPLLPAVPAHKAGAVVQQYWCGPAKPPDCKPGQHYGVLGRGVLKGRGAGDAPWRIAKTCDWVMGTKPRIPWRASWHAGMALAYTRSYRTHFRLLDLAAGAVTMPLFSNIMAKKVFTHAAAPNISLMTGNAVVYTRLRRWYRPARPLRVVAAPCGHAAQWSGSPGARGSFWGMSRTCACCARSYCRLPRQQSVLHPGWRGSHPGICPYILQNTGESCLRPSVTPHVTIISVRRQQQLAELVPGHVYFLGPHSLRTS